MLPAPLCLCLRLWLCLFSLCLLSDVQRTACTHFARNSIYFSFHVESFCSVSDANRWCRMSFPTFLLLFFPCLKPKHVPLSDRGSTNCIWRESSLFRWLQWGHILLLLHRLALALSHFPLFPLSPHPSPSVGNQHKRATGKLRRRP